MAPADALLAACLADPDADLPRLLYADALDDAGDDAFAAFVRAQVALAHTPPWEPLAVLARHRRDDLRTGDPFRGRLPDTGSALVEWAEEPFRRGLPWAVRVRQLGDLLAVGDRLFSAAPVGELQLPDGVLDQWRELAGRPWLERVQAVRFTSTTLPIEPVRAFSERPGGIREVSFHRAESPATPGLLGDLVRSPLGRQLTALHLRNGRHAEVEELVEELETAPPPLAALSLVMMGLTPATARRLAAGPLLAPVRRLDLTHCQQLGDRGLRALLPARGPAGLQSLALAGCGLGDRAVWWLSVAEPAAGLRRLDLSGNPLGGDGLLPLCREPGRAGLRSLVLHQCAVTGPMVRHLTGATFWPGLVELDLRFNPLGDAGARHLLLADPPPDLTALLLTGTGVSDRLLAKLRAKFGEAVVSG
jgi:uncharacterized protein (TIGR02996 family)